MSPRRNTTDDEQPSIAAPIDIAIITALAVERDAVLRRIDGIQKIQVEGEPLTFYVGRVPIPLTADAFTVVVTQLVEMGNNDAAITATRVIQRWMPRNVLMVGIAGGVEGKADLGDIVVSRFAFYYEPAKLIDEAVEHRGQQFNSDLLLYARAQHFHASEWKAEIGIQRPDADAGEPKLPQVRFGPIASGEKVIASAKEIADLRAQCPKMVAIAMEGAGVAKAVLCHGAPPHFLEIRGISDNASGSKNDDWHDYAANAAAAYAVEFLRSRPFSPGPPPEQSAAHPKVSATLILCAQSLRKIAADELTAVLDRDLTCGELEFLALDFTDLVVNKSFADPEAAAQRLAGPESALLDAIARRTNAHLVFHGLAVIPPIVLAGHIVTDRRLVRLFDYHPDAATWKWPPEPGGFPALGRVGIPERVIDEPGDALIRVAVSYPVNRADTDALELDARLQIDLSIPQPVRNAVRSEAQVRAYGRVFRETLDQLRTVMPNCQRVHLFYAGPMALAFHLGQQISENIHPPVIAWNFSRGYEWGIDLAAAVANTVSVVRPAHYAKKLQGA